MTNHGIVTDGANDLAALRAENLRLRDALALAILAGRNLYTELEAHQENTGEYLGAEDECVVLGAKEDLDHAEQVLATLTTPSEAPEPVADESGRKGEAGTCPNLHCPGCMEPDDEDDFATPPNPTNGDAVREALEIAHLYVAEAVRKDGGIDHCDMDTRGDYETVVAALAKHGGAEG